MGGQEEARPNRRLLWVYGGFVLFCCAGHALTQAFHVNPGWIAPLSAATCLLLACWVCVGAYGFSWQPLLLFCLGALIEVLGIGTGFPFGVYGYTNRWWPTITSPIGFFPLLVPFAWLATCLSCFLLFSSLRLGLRAFAVGASAMGFDVVMEPVMSGRMKYWVWSGDRPPFQNFVAWFVLGALGSVVLGVRWGFRGQRVQRVGMAVLAGQVVLILVLWIT